MNVFIVDLSDNVMFQETMKEVPRKSSLLMRFSFVCGYVIFPGMYVNTFALIEHTMDCHQSVSYSSCNECYREA